MSAPARRRTAAYRPMASLGDDHDLWREAVSIRQEWLGHGLSTDPADRATAEYALTRIYARTRRPRPRFVWVDSPCQALRRIAGLPTLDELYQRIRQRRPAGPPPLASDIATVGVRLRAGLSVGVSHADPELSPVRQRKTGQPWPVLPPADALAAGVPLGVLLHQGIRAALHASLATGLRQPVRGALDHPVPVCWYGQHDASWIAYYDALRRLGLARYGPAESDQLADWADLARSCGWWWPGDTTCVVVDRPSTVLTDPVPGAWHDETRLRPGGIRYRDGWRPPLR